MKNFTENINIIDLPKFNQQFTVDEIATWASDDGRASYAKTLAELEPWIEGLEEQIVIGGLGWTRLRVWKSVWLIFGLHGGMLVRLEARRRLQFSLLTTC